MSNNLFDTEIIFSVYDTDFKENSDNFNENNRTELKNFLELF